MNKRFFVNVLVVFTVISACVYFYCFLGFNSPGNGLISKYEAIHIAIKNTNTLLGDPSEFKIKTALKNNEWTVEFSRKKLMHGGDGYCVINAKTKEVIHIGLTQ